MRLAIVDQDIVRGNGQGRANYEIAKYALSEGHEVFLVANSVDEELIREGALWSPAKIPKLPMLLTVFLFVRKSNKILNKIKPDIVYGTGFSLTKEHDVNTAQFVHAAWMKCLVHTPKLRNNAYRWYQLLFTQVNAYLERITFNRSKTIVAVSNNVKCELINIGIRKEKIHVVSNGVDINELFPGKASRKRLNLPRKVPLALFVGDIKTSRKNLDTVLKALVHVPKLHLVVAGHIEGSPYIKMANELGLNKRVRFLGYSKDVAEIMRAVDFFVFPSRYDPFGIVILEAMASGLPVITSKTVGASELITLKSGIVLKNPNDTGALAQAMSLLVKDHKKRKEMGKSGRAVAEKYTWKRMAKNYMGLFEELNR